MSLSVFTGSVHYGGGQFLQRDPKETRSLWRELACGALTISLSEILYKSPCGVRVAFFGIM